MTNLNKNDPDMRYSQCETVMLNQWSVLVILFNQRADTVVVNHDVRDRRVGNISPGHF
jgi:hypothetical protein